MTTADAPPTLPHQRCALDDQPVPVAVRALELDPQVALRPEPFGALAYHHGTRKLVFLRHVDIVRVVRSLHEHPTLAKALDAAGIAAARRPAFERAVQSLIDSEMLRDRAR